MYTEGSQRDGGQNFINFIKLDELVTTVKMV